VEIYYRDEYKVTNRQPGVAIVHDYYEPCMYKL